MRKNSNNEIILTETEFLNIVGNNIQQVEDFIEVYGEDVTLGELLDSLRLHEELS